VVNNDQTERIDVRHLIVRDNVAAMEFRLDYVPNTTKLADVFARALPREPHSRFSHLIMMADAERVVSWQRLAHSPPLAGISNSGLT
jgi:hypothetical protein